MLEPHSFQTLLHLSDIERLLAVLTSMRASACYVRQVLLDSCVQLAKASSGPCAHRRTHSMAGIDRGAAARFLRTAFESTDWVAVFLKS
jgi:hypothetical protein